MIQGPSKDLTLIVYDTPNPPKYIKINKFLMKMLIFIIPIIIIISVGSSLFTSVYMKQQIEQARSQEPEIILNLREKSSELASELEALKKTNSDLIQKISSGTNTKLSTDISGITALIAIPLGFKDLRSIQQAKLENLTSESAKEKVLFKFDILNNKKNNEKLAGFITVVQYHKDGISFYPNYDLSIDSPSLVFSKGESFVVSRFRPVVAEFKKPKGTIVWYKIFIFSHAGDLISYKKTQNFTLD